MVDGLEVRPFRQQSGTLGGEAGALGAPRDWKGGVGRGGGKRFFFLGVFEMLV